MKLARFAPAHSPDVLQLLYLWGPKPADDCVDWIEERAREANDSTEKQRWLIHLSNIGQHSAVVQIVEKQELLKGKHPFELVQTYVRALGHLKDLQKIERVITEQFQQDADPVRLQALARLAMECSQVDLAATAFIRLLEKKPSDFEAHKTLGLFP